MSVQLAVIIGPIAVMFFWAWNAYKLVESDSKTHEALGLFMLLMAFVHTIIVANVSATIAKNTPLSAGVITSLQQNYLVAVIVFIIVTVYFVLRVMVIPMLISNKKKKLGLREE